MVGTPHYPEDDETSLLDLLQTIFDDLRLLVIGPIVAGLLALAGTSFWPKTYESTAILKVKAESSVTTIMLSAAVLGPIASSLGYTHKIPLKDARKLDSAVGTSASEVLKRHAQVIEVTKKGYGQYLFFLLKNIPLL